MNLIKQAEKAVKKQKQQLVEQKNLLDAFEELLNKSVLPSLVGFEGTIEVDAGRKDIDITIPWDVPKVNSFIETMKNKGWKTNYKFPPKQITTSSTTLTFHNELSVISIWVYVRMDIDGATCELVKIGEKEVKKIESIYEAVCSDGASETVFEK